MLAPCRHNMACLPVGNKENRLQIWTANKGWPPALGLRVGFSTLFQKIFCVMKLLQSSQNLTVPSQRGATDQMQVLKGMRFGTYTARSLYTYWILATKTFGKCPLGKLRYKSEDNIKMLLVETAYGNRSFVEATQNRVECQAYALY
jgi:hypothetical protein